MKVVYITLDPLRYPRVRKIAYSLKKCGNIAFHAMIPKARFVPHGSKMKRALFAAANYAVVLSQILFVKSDVFWVTNCPDILVAPLVFRRKKYILEYRSPWPFEIRNEFGLEPLVFFAGLFEKYALSHASLVTLTTSKLLRKAKSFRKRAFVIPNYPLATFGISTLSREELRRSFDCRRDDKIVLFVGKLTRVEGTNLLPRIIEEVLGKAGAVFWIVGDGPLRKYLDEFANRFPGRVKMFGWQPYHRIPDFIKASDVCITPRNESAYSGFYNEEGLQKFSEYMFFEKPIVACGVAESREYLLVKENEMAEGILKALNGLVRPSRRKTWEDYSEEIIYEMMRSIKTG